MDSQFVILVIIYLLYLLLSAFLKRVKEQSRQAAPRAAHPSAGGEAPQPQLPAFLQQMLGVEQSAPAATPPSEHSAGSDRKSAPAAGAAAEAATSARGARYSAQTLRAVSVLPAAEKKARRKVFPFGETSASESLRRAVIMKEILDAPLCKRRRRFPYMGEI